MTPSTPKKSVHTERPPVLIFVSAGLGLLAIVISLATMAVLLQANSEAGEYLTNTASSTSPLADMVGACPQDAQLCPDGSYVGRVSPTCEFAACPEATSPAPTTASSSIPVLTNDDDLVATSSLFAAYAEPTVEVTPNVAPYKITSNLSNVLRADEFNLTTAQKQLVAKNGFAVSPGQGYEFYQMYETDRYNQTPFFVTTDSLAHSYHLIFDTTLKRLEEQKLAPSLLRLTNQMLAVSLTQYQQAKGTAWEEAARRNVGFFAVAQQLLDPSAIAPASVSDQVTLELQSIEFHTGRTNSALFPLLLEDYSQYVPRGHYTKTEELQRYFKAMMWYGRIGMDLTPGKMKDGHEQMTDEIRGATLMTIAMRDPLFAARWHQISDPIGFIVGQSDDTTWEAFEKVIDASYANSSSLQAVMGDADGATKLIQNLSGLPQPKINSGHITATTSTRAVEFRFMGQRFTVDANIFQQLIHDQVRGRMLPQGLDIPAAYGSNEAYDLVRASEPQYANAYSSQMKKARAGLASDTLADQTKTLYGAWMHALTPLTTPAPSGYPTFMQNVAWTRKQLESFLGSWTELKHDTVLYAKQAYAAEMGGGPDIEEPAKKDDRGYVEPQPLVYARLAALADMTHDALSSRRMLDPATGNALLRLSQLSTKLKEISIKELQNTTLTTDEYDFIRGYGGDLEHLWSDVQDPLGDGTYARPDQSTEPAALITDVATDPSGGRVLEDATGYVAYINVVVPIEGKLHMTQGGVFTQYEFPHDSSDRMTDEAWRQMLQDGTNPPQPAWTNAFTSTK